MHTTASARIAVAEWSFAAFWEIVSIGGVVLLLRNRSAGVSIYAVSAALLVLMSAARIFFLWRRNLLLSALHVMHEPGMLKMQFLVISHFLRIPYLLSSTAIILRSGSS